MKIYIIKIDNYKNGTLTTIPFWYKSKNEALEYIYCIIEEEIKNLNFYNDDKLISYGIVDYECNNGYATINKYTMESEFDDTGETEIIAKYKIVEFIEN